MKFHYSFQKIVDLKNNQRTQAEWMLSEAIAMLQVEKDSLSDLLAKKDELQRCISNAAVNSTKIFEIQEFQDHLDFIERQIYSKYMDVQKAERHVTNQQGHLTDKMMDEKIWTKSKEKAYVKFQQFTLKKEQEVLDEMATMRYIGP
jgi:flagellar FliJ protein